MKPRRYVASVLAVMLLAGSASGYCSCALYGKPKILLLDEATSALVTERETAVNQVVKNLGITTLLLAHSDSTVAITGKRMAL